MFSGDTPQMESEIRVLETVLESHIKKGSDQKIIDDFKQTILEKKSLFKYEKGFNILMEFWDCLPDQEKPKIHEQLKGLGL